MHFLRHLNTSTSQLAAYGVPEYLIRFAIYSSFVVSILHSLTLFLLPNSLPSILADLVLIVSLTVLLLLLRRGHVELTKRLFLMMLWLYISAGMILFGGIRNPLFGSFIVLILFSALLGGRNSLILYTVLSAFSAIIITVMDSSGYIGRIGYLNHPLFILIGMLANLCTSFLLVYLTFQWIQSALKGVELATTGYDRERLLLRTLVDAMPEGVFVKDSERKFSLANTAFAKFAGHTTSEALVDHQITDFQTPILRALSTELTTFNPDDSTIVAREFALADQDRWYTLMQAGIRNPQGKLAGTVGIVTDITAQKRLEHALRHTTEQERLLKEKQRTVNAVMVELSRLDKIDELCRLAVVYGRERLGFDRLGLFLFDVTTQRIFGTWGTDEEGNLRDEHYYEQLLTADDAIQQVMESRERIKYWVDVDLIDNNEKIGEGWNAMAVLWDGDRGIGWLATDNFLRRDPFDERQVDILAQYGTALGHLLARLQAVDQLRQSQRVLQVKSDSLSALAKISEVIHHSLDLDELVRISASALLNYLNVNSAIFYQYDAERSGLTHLYDTGINPEILELITRYGLTDTPMALSIHNQQILVLSVTELGDAIPETLYSALQNTPVTCVVSIPLINRDVVSGVIVLGFTRELNLSEEEFNTYQAIGRTLGLAIANADTVKQVKLERDLADLVVDSIPGLFVILDDHGSIQRWNSNFVRESGLSHDELSQKALNTVFPKQQDAFTELIETTRNQGEMSLTVMLEVADQTIKPYLLTTRLYVSQGSRGIICIGLDISERMRLIETIEHRATQLQVAGTISKTIATVLDTQSALQQSVDLICSRFNYYYVGAFLLDNQNEYAVLQAGSGEAGRAMREANHRLKIGGNSMIGQSIEHRRAEITPNVAEVTVHYTNPYLPNTRSELAIPIIHRQNCLGALTVQSLEIDAFSQEDVTVIQFIADHLASTLENARLYNIISRRQRYLGTLRRVSNRVAPERDEKRFLEGVVNTLVDAFHYQSVQFFLVDLDKRELRLASIATELADLINLNVNEYTQSFDVGIFGYVATQHLAYLSVDCANDPQFQHFASSVEIGSELAVPVMHYGEIFGVLAISAKEPYGLDELDLEMMGEFSIELATHLENIRLFGQVQHNASELERRVEERTSQLKAVNHELEAFSYSVSHDLRSPLRSIDGFGQALLEDYYDVLDATGQEFLTRIRAATQRMGQLIDDLLTLSRVTRKELQLQDVNLSEIAQEIVGNLCIIYPERDVQTQIQADIVTQGDPRLLRIMLENLLGNAWKFTSRSEHATIELTSAMIDNRKTLIIRDNGVGFNMKYADKLFGAFQRLHPSDKFEGTGIGLATVFRIVQRHGGNIWAESEEGLGASFFIVLID